MRKELGMLGALVAMCIVIGVSNSGSFFSESNLLSTSRQVAMLGILSIGVGFVVITGGIDLSIGSIIGLTGVIIAACSASPEYNGSGGSLPIWAGISIAIAVALLIGLAQGLLITRLKLQPFIVTLGGMLLIKGAAQVITGGGNITFGSHPFLDVADGFTVFGLFTLPWAVPIFLAVVAAAAYLLHASVFGRHIYAIGGNRDAALYSGVPVKRIECLTYVISAGLAGIAGITYAAYNGQMSHGLGEGYELYAITAVVIGGCSLRGGEGTIIGIIIGAAMIRILDNGINMFKITTTDATGHAVTWGLSDTWRNVIIGMAILVAVIIDQMGHILQDRKRTFRSMASPPIAPKTAA